MVSFTAVSYTHLDVYKRQIHYIMLYVDGFSVFCTDKSHGMGAVLEIGFFFVLILFYQFGTGYSFGVHGYQCLHAVTAVNVEQLAEMCIRDRDFSDRIYKEL